jgi:ATP-binding cassette subfamily B protein
LFAKEGQELVRLGNKFRQWFRALWGYANSFRMIDLTIGVTGNVSLFLVMLVGLGQLSRAQISVGDYIMIFAFMMNFYPQFFELVYNFRNVAKHQTDINKYFSILNEETRVKDPQLPLKKTSVEGEIEFKGVDFGYPEGKEGAIKNLNLIIRQGQSIALVGHSGAGKTTLVKLLMRFYDPDKGQILIDGVDIKKFSKSGLRNLMGVVPQEPILFNNTIGYNIAYGAKRPSKQEIIASAKMANLDDFIKSLPKKYETQVGERGVKLSGGQKQRLAIARMILSDPDIIIFDEATSQLDSESEKKIQQAFWKAAENKTTIIIAHRLSTVARADKIAVMKDGRIVEIGSHRELLLKANSLYTKFWRLQTIN